MSPGDRRRLVICELALLALAVVTVASFARLLVGDWMGPLAAVTVTSWAVPVLARRARWNLAVAALATVLAGTLVSIWTVLGHTSLYGVPTGSTATAAREALSSAWQTFRAEEAPVAAEPGLLLVTAAAVVFACFLADWAAFRNWAPLEAVVPATTLFVFGSLVAGERSSVLPAVAFCVAVAAFVVLHRSLLAELGSRWWPAVYRVRTRRSLLRTASLLAIVAVAAGSLAGPRLPGAGEEALVNWDPEEEGSSQRVTISPLVDIRSRLVQQSDAEMFTVEADTRSYWRLTSLDTYGDGIWRSSGTFQAADGALPRELDRRGRRQSVDQTFEVSALNAIWLPAAYEAVLVSAPQEVRYHPASSTLIVDTDTPTSDGLTYQVRSEIPEYEPDQLRQVSESMPGELAERFLELPENVTPVAAETAVAVTGDAETDYDRARALQDWFQDEFTYDLEVPEGHDDNAIEAFLERRTGYCEQFAGTFAVMARTLGIPSRVAVGFTPGEVDPTDPDRFIVRGEHAHAWPEVWLGEHGWVAFEPTPGRGVPGGEAHTGLPEAQEGEDPDPEGPGEATTTVPETVPPAAPPTPPPSPPTPPEAAAAAGEDGGISSAWLVAAAVFALGIAYLAAVPLALRARRRVRAGRSASNSERVATAWRGCLAALADLGWTRGAPETSSEFAARAGTRLPGVAGGLVELAGYYDAATFAPGDMGPGPAERAEDLAEQVRTATQERMGRAGRIRHALDPRPLLRRRGRTQSSLRRKRSRMR